MLLILLHKGELKWVMKEVYILEWSIMSINPIELLKQKVTSTLLNDQDGLANEKVQYCLSFIQFF